jgi:glucose/arabinose dehydrogenase
MRSRLGIVDERVVWRWNGGALLVAALALTPAASADELPAVALLTVADGLTAPLDLGAPDDGSGRLLITEQAGLVRVLDPARGLLESPFLDLRHRLRPLDEGFDERGLLGLALHPDFATNGRLFVTYTAPLRAGANPGWNHTRRVSELTVDPSEPDRADADSERVLLEIDWPSRKHIGGGLAFGPDGLLHVGLGDGGGAHGVGE